MENEFQCLVVRGCHGGHFSEKFVKKYFSCTGCYRAVTQNLLSSIGKDGFLRFYKTVLR